MDKCADHNEVIFATPLGLLRSSFSSEVSSGDGTAQGLFVGKARDHFRWSRRAVLQIALDGCAAEFIS